MAATALVYAKMTLKDLEGAEDVVRKYISEDTPCTDENDILFMAAADLYLVNGKEKRADGSYGSSAEIRTGVRGIFGRYGKRYFF